MVVIMNRFFSQYIGISILILSLNTPVQAFNLNWFTSLSNRSKTMFFTASAAIVASMGGLIAYKLYSKGQIQQKERSQKIQNTLVEDDGSLLKSLVKENATEQVKLLCTRTLSIENERYIHEAINQAIENNNYDMVDLLLTNFEHKTDFISHCFIAAQEKINSEIFDCVVRHLWNKHPFSREEYPQVANCYLTAGLCAAINTQDMHAFDKIMAKGAEINFFAWRYTRNIRITPLYHAVENALRYPLKNNIYMPFIEKLLAYGADPMWVHQTGLMPYEKIVVDLCLSDDNHHKDTARALRHLFIAPLVAKALKEPLENNLYVQNIQKLLHEDTKDPIDVFVQDEPLNELPVYQGKHKDTVKKLRKLLKSTNELAVIATETALPTPLINMISDYAYNDDQDFLEKIDAIKPGESIPPVITDMLENGYGVDTSNDNGKTALAYACQNGNSDLVKLLIEYKANVNIRDRGRLTPIMVAAKNGHLEIIKILLKHGADKDKSKFGKTARDYAQLKGHEEIVKFLENYEEAV